MATVDDTFTATSTASSATLTVPVPRAVAAGKKLVLFALRDDAAGAPGGVGSIVDSRGNAWSLHDAVSLRAGTGELTAHSAQVVTPLQAGDSITITWNANRARKLAAVHVCSGLTAAADDANSGATVVANPTQTGAFGTSATPSAVTTGPTGTADGLTFGACAAATSALSVTQGAGYTKGADVVTAAGSNDRRLATESKGTAGTGTQTADFTLGASVAWAALVVHYAGTAVPPAPTVADMFAAVSTAAGKSLVIPVPRAVPAGSTIALAAVRDDTAGAPGGVESIVDNRGNAWVLHDAFSLRSTQAEVTWHHCHVKTALQVGDTITITWNANRARKLAAVHVLTGMQLVPVDATSGQTITSHPTNSGATGTSATPSASTQAATTQAKGMLLAAVGTSGAAGAITPGAGFTAGAALATDAGASDRQLFTEHRTLTTTGIKTADATLANSAMWAEAVIAFAAVAASAPPTANAGPDQTVEPWSTVTVGGTDTTAPGTSITQIAWTQLSGPPVALSGADAAQASFSAPPGAAQATVVLRKTVTDGNGGTASDDVAVTVLRATEFCYVDGVLVPFQIRG